MKSEIEGESGPRIRTLPFSFLLLSLSLNASFLNGRVEVRATTLYDTLESRYEFRELIRLSFIERGLSL